MISVIIAGAGSGKRFGNRPKAFFRLGGRELIYYSVENFCPVADEMVAVLPAGCERNGRRSSGLHVRGSGWPPEAVTGRIQLVTAWKCSLTGKG